MLLNILKCCLLIIFSCTIQFNSPCFGENPKQDEISKKYGFTLEEEEEIGFQATLALVKKYGYYKNPLVNQYVANIGELMVKKVSKRPFIKYRFIVLSSSEVNAFAAPGGFIMVTKGTLSVLDNEAELAGVLAHEIAHIEEGHGLKTIANDPDLKEKLKQIKMSTSSGKALSQRKIDAMDQELKKYQGGSAMVNFGNAVNADNFTKDKIF